jgi:hypothetical protein
MASYSIARDANPMQVSTRAGKKQQIMYDSFSHLNAQMNNYKFYQSRALMSFMVKII